MRSVNLMERGGGVRTATSSPHTVPYVSSVGGTATLMHNTVWVTLSEVEEQQLPRSLGHLLSVTHRSSVTAHPDVTIVASVTQVASCNISYALRNTVCYL